MDWELIDRIFGVLSALAVVASVIYLAIQIRQNTRATFSQTHQAAMLSLAELAAVVADNQDLSRIFAEGQHDPDALSKDEYYRFAYLASACFGGARISTFSTNEA